MTIIRTNSGHKFVRSKNSGRKYRFGFALVMKAIQYIAIVIAVLAVLAFFSVSSDQDFGTFAMQMIAKTIGSIGICATSCAVALRIHKSF